MKTFRAWRKYAAESTRGITFFSESAADWPHLSALVSHTAEQSSEAGVKVHYLASDEKDPGLQFAHPRYRAFYIGRGFVRGLTLRDLRAPVLVTTLPDLGLSYFRRSIHPVHYTYVFHAINSAHMIYRRQAFDQYDSVFCVGPHHQRELRALEKKYGLKEKKLIEHGYAKLDSLWSRAGRVSRASERPSVLVAPTWGEPSLLEAGLAGPVAEQLLAAGYRVTVRAHPMTLRRAPEILDRLPAEVIRETGASGIDSYEAADLMISDWSGAALEFALAFGKPVLFIDTPKKVLNREYTTLGLEPLEESIRARIGRVLPAREVGSVVSVVQMLLAETGRRDEIRKLAREIVFNLGKSGEAGARHLIAQVSAHV